MLAPYTKFGTLLGLQFHATKLIISFLPLLVFDEIPLPEALQQITVTEQLPPIASSHQITATGQLPPITSTSELPSTPTLTPGPDSFTALSSSLVPPVPTKLIEKIEAGKFVDMSELLCDHLGFLKMRSTKFL